MREESKQGKARRNFIKNGVSLKHGCRAPSRDLAAGNEEEKQDVEENQEEDQEEEKQDIERKKQREEKGGRNLQNIKLEKEEG